MVLTVIITFVINISMVTFAYFVQRYYAESFNRLDVNLVFGRLDESVNPTGAWGSDTNPYLISLPEHLVNLYTLQNRADRRIIDENTVFQVSDEFGKPNYIGSFTSSNLMNISSIGTEDFPFVSTLRGVKTTNSDDFVTLPSGERSDTSVLGNIKVNAASNQFDIGLFGNVGPKTMPSDGQPVGEITTLLLYNIQISSTAVGIHNPSHKHFVTAGTYETNHTGILIGHAQYTKVSTISVYYSGPNQDKDVKAFNINAGSSAKYTTAQGIIGYYTDLVVNEDSPIPVSSTGFINEIGGSSIGLGLGVVYSEDIWKFMEKEVYGGATQTNENYPIKETFGAELYGAGSDKRAFNVGVFTFAHSKQTKGKDRLEQLWDTPGSNNWQISTNGNYSTTDQTIKTAKQYTTTKMTSAHMVRDGTTHVLNTTYRNQNNYRYMLTVSAGTGSNIREYALVRYGDNIILKEVTPSTFIIPEDELNYYTFESLQNRTSDANFPPYTTGTGGAAFRYHTQQQIRFHNPAVTYKQFAGYGYNSGQGQDPDFPNRYMEGVRPLRIYSGSPSTVTVNASSTASIEGILYRPVSSTALVNTDSTPQANVNNANYYENFILQRTNEDNGNPGQNYFMTFNEATGLSVGTFTSDASQFNNAAKVKLYAVNTSTATNANYTKRIKTPTAGVKTFDMSETVLRYTGNPTSTNNATKYSYNVESLESLNWSDNSLNAITKADKALTMGDGTSYYLISNVYWGVAENLASPITPGGKVKVPYGAVGFTVAPTGSSLTRSKVFVIVASDPSTDVNQEITMSRFGSLTSSQQTGNRTPVLNGTFVLPPVPDRREERTIPIVINDNGSNRTVYPNMNRLLIAYEIEVRNQYEITYFLEASIGVISIVYLSAEQTASTDNNPTHKNKVNFPYLTDIDFVVKSTSNNNLHTVGSAGYSPSLTALYYGLKPNPANPEGLITGVDPVLVSVTAGLNFTYEIGRVYNTGDQKYYLYVTVDIPASPNPVTKAQLIAIMNNYHFEFAEWSYVDTSTLTYAYSDVVVMTINGFTITDWVANLT